jgi:hypothetical protein
MRTEVGAPPPRFQERKKLQQLVGKSKADDFKPPNEIPPFV